MTYRIPISTVQGTTVYREVDPREDGDDPLMRWMRDALDWDICNLKWSERQEHPEMVTWRGGELWDARTDGQVTVTCKFPTNSAPHIQVAVPLRPAVRGTVDLGGFRWTIRPPTEAAPRVSHGASVGNGNTAVGAYAAGVAAGFAVTTGQNNVAIGRNALMVGGGVPATHPFTPAAPPLRFNDAEFDDAVDPDTGEGIAGPYRTAGDVTVTPGSLLHVTCFAVVDAAFKVTLEANIRRVYKMFEKHAKLNTVIV